MTDLRHTLTAGFATLALAIVAPQASAAPIPVTFDFDEGSGDAEFDTITPTAGVNPNPYTIVDSLTGQSISFVVGYKAADGVTDVTNDSVLQLAGSPGNGSGIDSGFNSGLTNDQSNQLDSTLGGGRSNEFIEFTFTAPTTLVSLNVSGIDGSKGEQYEVVINGGTPIVVDTDADFVFAADTTLGAGDTLRVNATAFKDGFTNPEGETVFRFQELNVEIVPEPGAAVTGMLGLGLLTARRRASAS
ncbi:MAG: hypothetical protein AAGI46_11170 [Planctomycetota bacterium]